jgi:hypothetical protein
VLDDGDLNGFITKMTTAFGKDFQALDATLTALLASLQEQINFRISLELIRHRRLI